MTTSTLLNLPQAILELVSGASLCFYSNLHQIQKKRTRPLASDLSPGGQLVHRPPGSRAAWEITGQMSLCLTAALEHSPTVHFLIVFLLADASQSSMLIGKAISFE